MKGNKWTWVASTRRGIDSSPKAVKARSQRINEQQEGCKDKFLSPGPGCFPPSPPSAAPQPVGDGGGAMGFSKNLLHLVFDGRHSCQGVCLMDGIVYLPFEYRIPEDFR